MADLGWNMTPALVAASLLISVSPVSPSSPDDAARAAIALALAVNSPRTSFDEVEEAVWRACLRDARAKGTGLVVWVMPMSQYGASGFEGVSKVDGFGTCCVASFAGSRRPRVVVFVNHDGDLWYQGDIPWTATAEDVLRKAGETRRSLGAMGQGIIFQGGRSC